MFDKILESLERELGIVVSDPLRSVLARQLPQATREQLLAHLTNGQTYFFRHPEQCQAFEDHLRQSDPIVHRRIWSAGCSTGCEAYSIAIMLDRARRSGRVLGSDISPDRLREASAGIYRQSRMLRLSESERQRYFLPAGEGLWRVQPFLAGMVNFELENLIQDSGPGMSRLWDVIFCRNVLIYFDEARARQILERMVARLEMGGLLVLGYPEAFFGLQHPELTLLAARSAIFCKEASRPAAAQPDTRLPNLPLASSPGPFQEGLRQHAMGRLQEARLCFGQAAEADPELSLVHYFNARLYDELKQKGHAVASLQKFFETYREDDPRVLAFTRRNGLTIDQLSLAARRLRERLDRGLA
jgi:chemotaxis methyl-accepting protein methylase